MKRNFILIAILSFSQALLAQHYDFSAVAPSGQTLYYSYLTGGSGNSVYVTYPAQYLVNTYGYDGYTAPTGALIIPSSVNYGGTTYTVTSIGSSAFSRCTGLTSVTIPNTVISIENWAFCFDEFSDGSGLTSISIPNSVTSIGNYSFGGCNGLTSLSIIKDSRVTLS